MSVEIKALIICHYCGNSITELIHSDNGIDEKIYEMFNQNGYKCTKKLKVVCKNCIKIYKRRPAWSKTKTCIDKYRPKKKKKEEEDKDV